MADEKKRGLGRGLSALLADVDFDEGKEAATPKGEQQLPIEYLVPNGRQPRRYFDQEELKELADSISVRGVVQPIIARRVGENVYEIVAGERRWRAAQMAKLHQMPVIVREYSDLEVQEIALIENIQRSNLNALEEAAAYRALMDEHGHTQEKLSEALGKSRSHIANLLRLLSLPQNVQEALRENKISMGHARALIGLSAADSAQILGDITKNGLSVRETEARVRKLAEKNDQPAPRSKPNRGKNADTQLLERELSAAIGMKLVIEDKDGAGQVKINYRDLDELDRLCQLLGK